MDLIGLDIGTTGCKASLFDDNGNLTASASREYAIDIPHPGWAEQDPEKVWRLAQEALRQVVGASGSREVGAIGLSVQGEAVTPVDDKGISLYPMILGMDTRTVKQNDWLVEKLGAEHLFELTGMPVHTINTLPKLLWLKQNHSDIWKNARHFLLYEDYLVYKMTGRPVISRCLASRTQLYELNRKGWSVEILNTIDMDPDRLSSPSLSGEVVDVMSSRLAKDLGFLKAPVIVSGGHDQACGALGVGLTKPGLAMVSTGTAEVVEVALNSPVLNQALYAGNISCYEHVVPGQYLAMTINHSGGLLLRWFRDTLCTFEWQLAQEKKEEAYEFILRDASPEPSSLLVLPHFAGSGTPTFDTASKGAILGLTFATTKTELVKAILEGLTYELRLNLEILKNGGVMIHELRAIGGGARSPLWLQLKADITGIRVVKPQITEAAAWGAAVLGGVGAGIFPSTVEAISQSLKFECNFEPDKLRGDRYNSCYQLYREVYPAVSTIHHRMGGAS